MTYKFCDHCQEPITAPLRTTFCSDECGEASKRTFNIPRSYSKVFRDKQLLEEMIALKQRGRASKELARKYKVDHSTITYQWQKHTKKGNTWTKNERIRDTWIKDEVVRANKSKYTHKPKLSPDKCPSCELLYTSKYSCGECKGKKIG